MADDYAFPQKRKTKRDKLKKKRYGVYKKGGKFRSSEISEDKSKGGGGGSKSKIKNKGKKKKR